MPGRRSHGIAQTPRQQERSRRLAKIRHLQRLGLIDDDRPAADYLRGKPRKRGSVLGITTTKFGERFADDIGSTVRDAPLGAASFGWALYRDLNAGHEMANRIRAAKRLGKNPKFGRGRGALNAKNLMFPHTRAIARTAKDQFWSDIRHPLRHPGHSALAALSLATGGVGGAVRGGQLASAARVAARARPPRAPRVVAKRRDVKALDPNRLGVDRLVRDLKREKRAGTKVGRVWEATRPPPTSRAKRHLKRAPVTGYLLSRRQRAASKLAGQRPGMELYPNPTRLRNDLASTFKVGFDRLVWWRKPRAVDKPVRQARRQQARRPRRGH